MAPKEYFKKVKEQIATKVFDITTIDSETLLLKNLEENEIPVTVVESTHANYEQFLLARRKLMAKKIKEYYQSL